MSVTAEQWAQAEAERQRQADMVQTLTNEVRRLGKDRTTICRPIQRLTAGQFLPTPRVDPLDAAGQPPQATPAGRGIIENWKPLVFSGDENTWRDWSFKLRSYVSVVDLQLGSARKRVGTKCAGEPRHGRTAQVSARHADQRTRTAGHPTSAEWSAGIPRSCPKVQSAFASTFPGTGAGAHAFRFLVKSQLVSQID